jgi:hypothetical protein
MGGQRESRSLDGGEGRFIAIVNLPSAGSVEAARERQPDWDRRSRGFIGPTTPVASGSLTHREEWVNTRAMM